MRAEDKGRVRDERVTEDEDRVVGPGCLRQGAQLEHEQVALDVELGTVREQLDERRQRGRGEEDVLKLA